jgi:hypothetical protein
MFRALRASSAALRPLTGFRAKSLVIAGVSKVRLH